MRDKIKTIRSRLVIQSDGLYCCNKNTFKDESILWGGAGLHGGHVTETTTSASVLTSAALMFVQAAELHDAQVMFPKDH